MSNKTHLKNLKRAKENRQNNTVGSDASINANKTTEDKMIDFDGYVNDSMIYFASETNSRKIEGNFFLFQNKNVVHILHTDNPKVKIVGGGSLITATIGNIVNEEVRNIFHQKQSNPILTLQGKYGKPIDCRHSVAIIPS